MSKKNGKTEFQKRRSWLAKADNELKQKEHDKKTAKAKDELKGCKRTKVKSVEV